MSKGKCVPRPDPEDEGSDWIPGIDGMDIRNGEDDRDIGEPVGSCDWCEANLYEDDGDGVLCDRCLWLSMH